MAVTMTFTCRLCRNKIKCEPDGVLRSCSCKATTIDHTLEYTRFIKIPPVEHKLTANMEKKIDSMISDQMQNQEPEWYPICPETGFAVSSKDYKQDMAKYNMIVIDVLNAEEQKLAIEALWSEMGPRVTSDPSTWETENWPDPDHPFLSNRYAIHPTAFRNRVHPRLMQAYQVLHGHDHLLSTIDFWGVKRATFLLDGQERKDWRLKPLKLHWDVDVIKYVQDKKPRYQALIALNDNDQAVGSFACVPGSANRLKAWVENQNQPDQKKYVPRNDPMQHQVQRIPLAAGQAVIWDMGLAHTNFSNYSTEPRLTQYCRMIPNQLYYLEHEKQALTHFWKHQSQLQQTLHQMDWTPEQRKSLGLRP